VVRRGRLITLEGTEGSGKSVQLRLLHEEFERRGVRALSTREPGGTPFGSELRDLLLKSSGAQRVPVAELLLYLADRCQHLQEVVEPELARGGVILCDRYHDATLAYQGYARGLGFDLIDRLAEMLDIRKPDLTLLFDLDVTVGLGRAQTRNQQEGHQKWGRFEAESLDFHRRVREGYLQLARREPERFVLLDASQPVPALFESILRALQDRRLFKESK
jgi:dTMP kinase